ncbi:KRI1-like family C-terminal-domain-containing protein [Multifurca ochricompacta]|uniref:KRI1-like family C-terminal-domain-containing protein n=1 Tax=Multifurca ochricompacta TaxID=376703 RepID=A0AAD4QN61_9AGAM|nr:KRI1-like family C-terminal-domain-containing protein [Multifurca ochricompacta]
MKQQLISSSSASNSEDENDPHQFTINEHFAKAFQYRKEREELARLKEKYGSDADTDDPSSDVSDSESDESEDEDGEELTPALDVAILRTLARIKARDPGIYDVSRNVFEEEHSNSKFHTLPASTHQKKAKADKPLTLPGQRLVAALDAVAPHSPLSEAPSPPSPSTHVAEQAALRAETIAAFHFSTVERGLDANDMEQDEGGLFTLREKTKDEMEQEEAEYRAYLEREVGSLEKILDLGDNGKGETRPKGEEDAQPHHSEKEIGKGKRKRKKRVKSAVGEETKELDQEFLINYILNRGWIDRSARRIPTYKEVTAVPSHPKNLDPPETLVAADVSTDANSDIIEDEDEFDEVVERFESSYNFRFEEPDPAHILSFPRAVQTVRRPTEHAERRRTARERRRERKDAEKTQRREEIKRLKGLKTREVEAKLERIGKEGGWARSQALETLDLDGDWDAGAHDRQMAAILAEADGVGVGEEDEKPTWDDDIDVGDIISTNDGEARRASAAKERKKAKRKEKKRMRDDDASGVDVDEMDADADAPNGGGGDWEEVEWDGTEEMRKRVLDQYMEELYELEFNDMVAGMPTRFRYVPTTKASYALTPAELLLADDKDLNEYLSLKKLAPYRKARETWDAKRGERLREFKRKVSVRVAETGADPTAEWHAMESERRSKKRKGRKERIREKAARAPEEAQVMDSEEECDHEDIVGSGQPVKKKRRRQKRSGKPVEKAIE